MTVLLVLALTAAAVFGGLMWTFMILDLTKPWWDRLAWRQTERWARKHGYTEVMIAEMKRRLTDSR